MSAIVYGASDDLIEVEGDISEEFYPDSEARYLAFSTGALLRIKYDGTWNIRVLAGDVAVDRAEGMDAANYSDRATVNGDVRWVVCGQHAERRAPERTDSR